MTRRLLTASDAGRLLGLTSSGVRRCADAGQIRCLRDSTGRRLFREHEVQRFLVWREAMKRSRSGLTQGIQPYTFLDRIPDKDKGCWTTRVGLSSRVI